MGVGSLICTAQGCTVVGMSLLSCALPVSAYPRGAQNLGLHPLVLGLVDLCSWPYSTIYAEPLLELPLNSSVDQPGAGCRPLGSLAPGCGGLFLGCSCYDSVPGNLTSSPPLLGFCSNFLWVPFCPRSLMKLLLLWDGVFLSWGHLPRGLSSVPCGDLPLGCL